MEGRGLYTERGAFNRGVMRRNREREERENLYRADEERWLTERDHLTGLDDREVGGRDEEERDDYELDGYEFNGHEYDGLELEEDEWDREL